jgi:secreted protein with Ig-like and vWFA domain
MVVAIGQEVEAGRSLKSLVNGFVLTKQTEGKSHRTVEFYSENLRRFLWYASRQGWSDDIRMLTEWHVREFLGYLANERCRWGVEGNGSESLSSQSVSHYDSSLLCGAGKLLQLGSP